jgi:hypothetical protein
VEQKYDLTAIAGALSGKITGSGWGCQVSPAMTGAISMDFAKECCESKKSIVDSTGLKGSAGLEFTGQCNLPTPLTIAGIATVTIVGAVSLKEAISGSGYKSECKENCSWNVSGDGAVEFNLGLGLVAVDPNVLSLTGTVRATGSLKVQDACGVISSGGCFGPLALVGTAVFGGLFTKEVYYEVPNSQVCYQFN